MLLTLQQGPVRFCTRDLTLKVLRTCLYRSPSTLQAAVRYRTKQIVPRRSRSTFKRCWPRRIVATSEFWYEEEEEFDAVTDYLNEKHVYVAAAGSGPNIASKVASFLSPLTFQIGFASKSLNEFAEELWEGRAVPPYFYKLRYRDSLACGDRASCVAFWQEVLQQNWGVALEYGLGETQSSSLETLLVVCESTVVPALLAAVGVGTQHLTGTEGAVIHIAFKGCWSDNATGGGDFEALVKSLEPKVMETTGVAPSA